MAPELAKSLLRSSSTTEGLTAEKTTKTQFKVPKLAGVWRRRCETHGMLERWSVAEGGKMLE